MGPFSRIDKSNMRQVILDFPKQFRISIGAAKNIPTPNIQHPISNIVICGMGGSALPGDLLKMVNNQLSMTNLPIFIHRDYGLPKEANKKSLIICISFSGNTEETMSAFKEARQRKLKIINIASGGKLIEFSKKDKTPFVKIPGGIQPRCALGYQFAALLKILSNLKIIKNISRDLLNLERVLIPQKWEEDGKKLARRIEGFIPLVYSSVRYQQLARIWKIKFNENSKIPAFFNIFPELNHNEMTGIGECKIKKLRKKFIVIILYDKEDTPQILKRMMIFSQIFKERGIKTIFIEIKTCSPRGGKIGTQRPKKPEGVLSRDRGESEKNLFEKVFSNLLLADWTSFHLAINQKIDPTPVALVEKFKRKISSQ